MRVPSWAPRVLALAAFLLVAYHPVQSAPGSAGRDVLDSSNVFTFLEALSSNRITEADDDDAEDIDEGAEQSSKESGEEMERAHEEGVDRLGHYFMDDDAEEVQQANKLEQEDSATPENANSKNADEDAKESSEGASTGSSAEAPPVQTKQAEPAQSVASATAATLQTSVAAAPVAQSSKSVAQAQSPAAPPSTSQSAQSQPRAQPAAPTANTQTTTTTTVAESNKESTTTLALGLSINQKDMATVLGQSSGQLMNDSRNGTNSTTPPIILKYPGAEFVKNHYVTPVYDNPPTPTDKDYEIKAVQGTGGWKKAKSIPKDTLSPCNQGDPCPPRAASGEPAPPLTPLQLAKIKADAEIQKKFDKPVVTPRGWLRPTSECENCGDRVTVDGDLSTDPRYVVSAPEPSLPVTNINMNCQLPDAKC
jgi:flagellar basal body-associated protein FliL